MTEQIERTFSLLDTFLDVDQFYNLNDYKADYLSLLKDRKAILQKVYKTDNFDTIKREYELTIQEIELNEKDSENELSYTVKNFLKKFTSLDVTVKYDNDDLFSILSKVKNTKNQSLKKEKILTYVKILAKNDQQELNNLLKYSLITGYVNLMSSFFYDESLYNTFNINYLNWIKYSTFNDYYVLINNSKYVPHESYLDYKDGLSICGLNTCMMVKTGLKVSLLRKYGVKDYKAIDLELLGDIIISKLTLENNINEIHSSLNELMNLQFREINMFLFKLFSKI